ncbi:hypothetical protein ACHAPE_004444 [Trichoderma viride]
MTRGGRAWSEQEDAFLMQTRENKMPYKQIAHQLKKTELACRLHYHQLARNSARGRRNRGSVSSMSDLSPEIEAAASASTFRRRAPHQRAESESSMSTTSSREYYLPRITESSIDSARHHIILPRPAAMPDDSAYTSRASWRPHSVAEEFAPLHDQHYQHNHYRTPSLPPQREMLPLPLPSTAADMPAHVDLPRLHAIYDAHRGAFWNHIASEYGYNTSPEMLEDAWRAGVYGGVQYPCPSFNRPMTPVSSPEAERRHHGVDRTRISSIISGDDDADRR